ncbi:ubiquitin-conjugating enzyme E2 U-like [Actinia tenebrosa]|uniref:Ubiquitin-conjugating enzyme E2 U-like n=1 Tax=Actinia tenebrosa TaxID=6105 RepID=A0A6P8H4R8_ACTTE|nr:ubiquitin-conjugating enzyme E2 U-like [Actinia tenebrosa]
MQSRARLLLEKEQFKMKKDPVWGITAQPLNEDDWFTWEATVKGPKDTLWEGGIFKLYLQFNENYNCIPPKIYFHTVPFHPNVDPVSGIPCIDFLDNQEEWKEYYSINYMLLSIQMMLSNPILDYSVNVEAAKMCHIAPSAYKQMILENVLASKRVDAGLKPHLENEIEVTKPEKQEQPAKNTEQSNKRLQIAKISFDDYHSLWSGIATTRPVPSSKNPLNEMLKSDSKLQAAHFGMEQEELQEEIKKQIAEHNSLTYGKFDQSTEKAKDLEELKATRINMLKQIYLPKHQGQDKSTQSLEPSSASLSASIPKEIEPSEQEVQDLLNWSSNLGNNDVAFS